ncbi:regulatory-associated protein of mTOR-like [Penaeus monodon]|uniref:regulatory-associated protein of mTOR-like n=1 Tax=Penaeus monodon TaxID=6687 RepID=UPI0018A70B4D|nr:regulatory-associated protein of mTOR-like [Penaeus monodon]
MVDLSPQSLTSSTDSIMSPSNSISRVFSRQGGRQVTSPNQTLGTSPDTSLTDYVHMSPVGVKRTASTHSISSLGCSNVFSGVSTLSYSGMYCKLWQTLITLERDPFPAVASMAKTVVDYVRSKVVTGSRDIMEQKVESAPGTPVNKPIFLPWLHKSSATEESIT